MVAQSLIRLREPDSASSVPRARLILLAHNWTQIRQQSANCEKSYLYVHDLVADTAGCCEPRTDKLHYSALPPILYG